MRIIGGQLGGKKLTPFSGAGIRPTADRVREAIFNVLQYDISGSMVLDLFSGTGAFGLEALSRGAAGVVFIEKAPDAISLINKNIHACGVHAVTTVIQWDILNNLECIRYFTPSFDLVFLDPPYQRRMIRPALLNLGHSGALDRKAIVVVEHSVKEPLSINASGFRLAFKKKYGKRSVSFLAPLNESIKPKEVH